MWTQLRKSRRTEIVGGFQLCNERKGNFPRNVNKGESAMYMQNDSFRFNMVLIFCVFYMYILCLYIQSMNMCSMYILCLYIQSINIECVSLVSVQGTVAAISIQSNLTKKDKKQTNEAIN